MTTETAIPTTQLLKEVERVRNMIPRDTLKEGHRQDEEFAYRELMRERHLYRHSPNDAVAAAREQRLRVLCGRYLRDFSRHVKG